MKTTVKLEGLRELEAALAELPKTTRRNAARRALIKAAGPMVADARRLAPSLTGHLRAEMKASGTLTRRQRRLHVRVADIEIFVGPDAAPQGMMQEFGTVDHPAQPFMRPAFDANVRGAIDTIGKIMGDEIERAAKRIARKQARLIAQTGGG